MATPASDAASPSTSAVTNQGGVSGASPWTLTTMSGASSWASASAQRSVPLRQSGEVISTRPPKPPTAPAMRASSVATQTAAGPTASTAASHVRSTSILTPSLPRKGCSGLPGKRVEA